MLRQRPGAPLRGPNTSHETDRDESGYRDGRKHSMGRVSTECAAHGDPDQRHWREELDDLKHAVLFLRRHRHHVGDLYPAPQEVPGQTCDCPGQDRHEADAEERLLHTRSVADAGSECPLMALSARSGVDEPLTKVGRTERVQGALDI